MRRHLTACLLAALAGLYFPAMAQSASVSFDRDVMAVLSKAGCNLGGCHGNKSGKASFKLSLRSEDPDFDFDALTRDFFGRRIDTFNPDQSLILLKPTNQIAHEGGQRFTKDSPEYRILRDWIAAGAHRDPADSPKLVSMEVSPTEKILSSRRSFNIKAVAKFSDGSKRDVTRLAVFEPSTTSTHVSVDGKVEVEGQGETVVLVRYLNQQQPVHVAAIASGRFKWAKPPVNNYVDATIDEKLKKLHINPSGLCTDNEYIRRASLDLLGIPPTAEEARAFVADKSPDKRNQLVDRLFARPEYADFWALKWSDLLRNEEKVLDQKGVQVFHDWIRQSFADNKPLDQFAHELIAARGSTYTNAPANFYRANRDAVTRGETASQLFLGTRLLCAKCHNHPFERWTQDDYYDWASLFARVDYKIVENKRRDKSDLHEFVGEQIVFMSNKGEVENARTGKNAIPRFLGDKLRSVKDNQDRLLALADWLASADNKMFVHAQVNRIWFHLMGRGIVDPVDDFRANNLPSNPALLEALSDDFVKHKFDVRHLIRTIMNSRTYQLSSTPNESNAADEINFSHVLPRRLQAEQMLDAISQLTGASLDFKGYPQGTRASQIAGVKIARGRDRRAGGEDNFLQVFGKPPRLIPTECERSNDTTMGQAFQLISGPLLNDLLTKSGNRLDTLLKSGQSNEQILDELFWTALSRSPNKTELADTVAHIKDAPDRRKGLEDITWALLNSKEFVLRN